MKNINIEFISIKKIKITGLDLSIMQRLKLLFNPTSDLILQSKTNIQFENDVRYCDCGNRLVSDEEERLGICRSCK